MGAAQSSRLADTLDPEDVPETLRKLRAASIRSESDLKMLNAGEWLELGLALGVRKRLQQEVGFAQPAAGAIPASPVCPYPYKFWKAHWAQLQIMVSISPRKKKASHALPMTPQVETGLIILGNCTFHSH